MPSKYKAGRHDNLAALVEVRTLTKVGKAIQKCFLLRRWANIFAVPNTSHVLHFKMVPHGLAQHTKVNLTGTKGRWQWTQVSDILENASAT